MKDRILEQEWGPTLVKQASGRVLAKNHYSTTWDDMAQDTNYYAEVVLDPGDKLRLTVTIITSGPYVRGGEKIDRAENLNIGTLQAPKLGLVRSTIVKYKGYKWQKFSQEWTWAEGPHKGQRAPLSTILAEVAGEQASQMPSGTDPRVVDGQRAAIMTRLDELNPEQVKSVFNFVMKMKMASGKKVARDWDKTLSNDNVRVRWNDDLILIEELPGKPVKRKVRKAFLDFFHYYRSDGLLVVNVIRKFKVSASSTFDRVLAELNEATIAELDRLATTGYAGPWIENAKQSAGKPWIDTISFLEVEPKDYKPMTVKGYDFVLTSEWTKFSAYSPNSDFQQTDPYYTVYQQKSPGAARRLFQILKADPTLLKNISWGRGLSDWLTKAGIGYESHSSSWR